MCVCVCVCVCLGVHARPWGSAVYIQVLCQRNSRSPMSAATSDKDLAKQRPENEEFQKPG